MTPLRSLSLRARLLLIGVVGVAVALGAGGVALYGVLTVVGYRTLDDDAGATAAEVVSLVEQGRLPDPIPVTGSQIVQVVDARDRVVSASVNADRLTSLLLPRELRRVAAGAPVTVSGSRAGLASPLRVRGRRTTVAGRVVLVAQQVQTLEESRRVLRLTLLGVLPLLLLVLAAIAWRVVGAALRPVEALRAGADRISGSGRRERLPVPTTRDEISALAQTLNSMLDRLAAARDRQRAFVADAAHELRSPLASLQAQLDVAHRLGEDTPASADVRAEVARMSALVEDLLTLARLDADDLRREPPGPVDLVPLLLGAAGRHGRDGVRVEVVGTDQPVPVYGVRSALERMVANLVDNAVRHATSCVEVGVDVGGDRVLVRVDDDGAGIPPEDRERVFERFTRLDEGRDRDAGGSGLGLAIVRELARRDGGDVELGASAAGGLSARLLLTRP